MHAKEWPREGIDIDVTRWLKPGAANTFTYRMIGTRDRTLHYGLVDRPLLWAAKTD